MDTPPTPAEDAAWQANLVVAAQALRQLLRDADSASQPLWAGPALDLAIERYVTIFLPMLAAHLRHENLVSLSRPANAKLDKLVRGARARLSKLFVAARASWAFNVLGRPADGADLRAAYMVPFRALRAGMSGGAPEAPRPIPPLDVALVWAAHRLAPSAYARDCAALFGAALPAGGPDGGGLAYVAAHSAGTPPAAVARLQWAAFARAATARRTPLSRRPSPALRAFLPHHTWPRFRLGGALHAFRLPPVPPAPAHGARPAHDLRAAVLRQKRFLHSVSAPYYDTAPALPRAAQRYARFLALARAKPGKFLVPAPDVDLAWHAHLLRGTRLYAAEAGARAGCALDHVEAAGGPAAAARQTAGWARTRALWREVHGEEYEVLEAMPPAPLRDGAARVLPPADGVVVVADERARNGIVQAAGVCTECVGTKAPFMHDACRVAFHTALRCARAGQADGGACAALFAQGFVGSATTTADGEDGACGGFAGIGGEGGGCGNGTTARCGAGECAAGNAGGGTCGGPPIGAFGPDPSPVW